MVLDPVAQVPFQVQHGTAMYFQDRSKSPAVRDERGDWTDLLISARSVIYVSQAPLQTTQTNPTSEDQKLATDGPAEDTFTYFLTALLQVPRTPS